MTPAPEGTPWWAWLIGVLLAVGAPGLITWVSQQRTRADVSEIKEQVKNTHPTNLRNDIDEAKSLASEAKDAATLAAESAHRTERHVEDLVRSIRAMEHSMDRRDKLQTAAAQEVRQDLDAHIAEIPALFEHVLSGHVGDCQLRTPRTE